MCRAHTYTLNSQDVGISEQLANPCADNAELIIITQNSAHFSATLGVDLMTMKGEDFFHAEAERVFASQCPARARVHALALRPAKHLEQS